MERAYICRLFCRHGRGAISKVQKEKVECGESMKKRYYTIGMAGHIDHGKTTLTKALTSVDTDRLKEEKERSISIEPGFAPLYQDEDLEISVVDVPGHERFIRQMIAGVAGIDLVVMVVSADEGVMPQTKEHLDILSLLGINQGIVVLTKISKVEEDLRELAREEIIEELKHTVFEDSPVLVVDSLTGEGVEELNETIISSLREMPARSVSGQFRLPIDQVFTIKGQGAVVRGTIYEGSLETGDELTILPLGIHTKAKQIQVHNRKTKAGYAGQRAAINLSGVDYKELKRGNVVVATPHLFITNTIDVSLTVIESIRHMIKQRMPVLVYTGTSEVMGKLVFFDRNKVEPDTDVNTILCQIRLDESIMVKRGDRFIVRRPSPVETIGGGWIIQPNGGKYRFGEKTIAFLQSEKDGTPRDRIQGVLEQFKSVDRDFLLKEVSISQETLSEVLQDEEWVHLSDSTLTHRNIVEECKKSIEQILTKFHESFPLLKGMNRGEMKQSLKEYPGELIDYALKEGHWRQEVGLVHLQGFTPHVPHQWARRCDQLLKLVEDDGTQVKDMDEYFKQVGIPEKWQADFYRFFVQEKKIVPLDDRKAYSYIEYIKAVQHLKEHTGGTFDVGEAKEALGLSRKYVIPFLEKLDKEGLTIRTEGNRRWMESADKKLKGN